jgi:hypothetical protein
MLGIGLLRGISRVIGLGKGLPVWIAVLAGPVANAGRWVTLALLRGQTL